MKEKFKNLLNDKDNFKKLIAIFVVLIIIGFLLSIVIKYFSNQSSFNDLNEEATTARPAEFVSTTAVPTSMPTTEKYTEPPFIMPNMSANDMDFIVNRWRADLKYSSYGDAVFNDIVYTPKGAVLPDDKKDAELGTCLITVYNELDGNSESLNVSGTAYKIYGVSPEVCIAVKMESDEGYHIFTNYMYYPATIQSLIDDYGLRGNLQVNKIYYRDSSGKEKLYTLKDHNDIFDKLLDDPNIPDDTISLTNGFDAGYEENPPVVISISISAIGDENVSIALNDSGVLQTNIMGISSTYEIGQAKVAEFKKYLENECESEDFNR